MEKNLCKYFSWEAWDDIIEKTWNEKSKKKASKF